MSDDLTCWQLLVNGRAPYECDSQALLFPSALTVVPVHQVLDRSLTQALA